MELAETVEASRAELARAAAGAGVGSQFPVAGVRLESQVAVTKTGEAYGEHVADVHVQGPGRQSVLRAAGSAAARSLCRPSGGTSFGRSASRLFNAIPTCPPAPVNHSLVGDGGGQGDGQLPRRDPALGAGAALSGAQGAGEGDPVGIQPGVSRGGGHQGRARRSAGTGSRRPLGGRRRGSSSGARPSGRAGGS